MSEEAVVVDWTEVDQLQARSFATGKSYVGKVKRESIPLVFVPGIMGSRLRVGKDLVWDPNSTLTLAKRYGFASPADRKKWLIDGPGRQVVEYEPGTSWEQDFETMLLSELRGSQGFDWLPNTSQNQSGYGRYMEWASSAGKTLSQQGWCQVAWSFYGPFLVYLSKQAFGDYTKFFMFPVYAVGYDWVDDNLNGGRRLVSKIAEIVKRENAMPGRSCQKVIVISHSMGGLVSRSAVQQDSSQILGVIHGAQPVNGAPAAYRRMRAGFEYSGAKGYIESNVMGLASKDVMPVLANCVGGLELLPTANYRDNNNESRWLVRYPPGGSTPAETQPQGSPYGNGVYGNQQDFLRLIYHADLLSPSNAAQSHKAGPSNVSATQNSFISFLGNLKEAEAFHSQLGLSAHPETYHMYVKGGLPCFHQVRFRYAHEGTYQETRTYFAGEMPVTASFPPQQGEGLDLDPHYPGKQGGAYFQIDPPDPDSGDGTVPRSSASALQDKVKGTCVVNGTEHSDFYNNQGVRDAAAHFIERLADQYKKQRKG